MTRPPDLVEIVCPRCGTVYTADLRPRSVDHEDESWAEDSGSLASAACPECGAEPGHDATPGPHAIGPHPARGR